MKKLIGRYFAQYRLKEIIGIGGMGTVFKAYEEELDRLVAIKVLHPSLSQDSQFVERFTREARLLASLSHPNLIHVYSIGKTEDGYHFFAMEYIKGLTLNEYIKEHHPISLENGWNYCGQVLSALWEIHNAGLVHRDVKPSNIMLASEKRAVLMDFGLTKDPFQPGLTREGIIAGTPEYMSPEQSRGDDLDGRSDIYSLGVMIYEIFSSVVPFTGKSAIQILRKHCESELPDLSEKRPDLEPKVSLIVRMAMAKNFQDRFLDAPDMADAMHKAYPTSELKELSKSSKISNLKDTLFVTSGPALDELTSTVESSKLTTEVSKPRRNRLLLAIGFILALALVSILGSYALKNNKGNENFADPVFINDISGTKIVANPICEFFLENNESVLGRFVSIEDGEITYIPKFKTQPEKISGVRRLRILSKKEREKLDSEGQ